MRPSPAGSPSASGPTALLPPDLAGDKGGGDSPSPGARSSLARGLVAPNEIATDVRLVGTNALIALVLVLLIAFPAELLNATLREHYEQVVGLFGWVRRWHGHAHRLANESHVLVTVLVFTVAGSLLYGLLDPSFGLDSRSGALLLGLLGALAVTTATHEIARGVYVERRFGKRGRLQTYPAGIALAIALVGISRLVHFEPGFLFGLFTGLSFSHRLSDREDGHGLAIASLFILVVAAVAWALWIPVKSEVTAVEDPGFLLLLLDTLLAAVWVAGVQSIIFALVPLRFMDGEKVLAWSRAGWLAVYGVSMFVFVHTVVHPASPQYGDANRASVVGLVVILVSFTVVAVLVWTYFRLRSGGGAAHASPGIR